MYTSFGKRLTDITISCLLLAGLSWLFLAIILSYLITSQRPVFFVQPRIGRANNVFRLIKFRTLKTDDRLPAAQRRFPLGDFLRRTSLDELPQLWNVLRGEMSLVGPRPLLVEYAPLFSDEQRRRHEVRPGITGWAQVNGRNQVPWLEKFELDLYYIRHVSFWLDMKILAMTLGILLAFRRDNSLSEEKFKGNA